MNIVRTLLFLFLGWARLLAAQVDPGAWERVYPTPSAEWLRSIVWGAAGFVAVGYQREMLFSETGVSWERIVHNPAANSSYTDFSNVSFAGGYYLVPAGQGRLIKSQNGRNWTAMETGTTLDFRFVIFSAGQWRAFSAENTMLVSSDLLNWQSQAVPADFVSLVEANGQILALASDSRLYVTNDFTTWSERPWSEFGFVPPIEKICFGGGRFVAVGGYSNGGSSLILISTDAVNWNSATIADSAWGVLDDCGFANGRFFAVGSYGLLGSYFFSQTILTSVDGLTWQVASSSPGAPQGSAGLSAIAAKPGGRAVAVGGGGAILTSDNGTDWLPTGSSPREYLHRALFANGRFVVVGGRPAYIGGPQGGAAIFSSSDGRTWHSFVPVREELLSDVAFGNGTWIVTGDDGGVFVSTDTLNWTDASIDIGTRDLRRVVFGNGKFLAFSAYRDLIYSSANGLTWTSADVPGVSGVQRVKFLNGQFTAACDGGLVMFSNDGLTWTTHATGLSETLNTISYGKGRWVIGGYFVLGYSLDGTVWHTSPAPMQVLDIDYVDGKFLGVGNIATMVASSDGANWESASAPAVTAYDIESITHGDGTLVCVGDLAIYRAALPVRIPWPSTPSFLFPEMIEFFGETGRQYRLLESGNLNIWQPVSDWRSGQNDYLIWDAPRSGAPSRFWRIERR